MGSDLLFAAKSLEMTQKLRVMAQVRNAHLAKQGKKDEVTEWLESESRKIEEFLNEWIRNRVVEHPAYEWFSQVKGVGTLNIGKVLAYIDIEEADTISSLWKYAGYGVTNGKGDRPVPGKKLCFNRRLKTMCYRLGTSLIRAKGAYYDYYVKEKKRIERKAEEKGLKIVSGKETEGTISRGHIDMMARRKMMKLFLAHLWLVWREALGLPITKPYAHQMLGHNGYVDPWKMVEGGDKDASSL